MPEIRETGGVFHRRFPGLSPLNLAHWHGKILSTAGETRNGDKNVNTYGEYIKKRRGCQESGGADMNKEEMIAEIQRVLEDANEWDVQDVYAYVMDEVA